MQRVGGFVGQTIQKYFGILFLVFATSAFAQGQICKYYDIDDSKSKADAVERYRGRAVSVYLDRYEVILKDIKISLKSLADSEIERILDDHSLVKDDIFKNKIFMSDQVNFDKIETRVDIFLGLLTNRESEYALALWAESLEKCGCSDIVLIKTAVGAHLSAHQVSAIFYHIFGIANCEKVSLIKKHARA